jgi:hypothetical protein
MREQFFAAINFPDVRDRKSFVSSSPVLGKPRFLPGVTISEPILIPEPLPEIGIIEDMPQIEPSLNWTFDQVLGDFYRVLGEMQSRLGVSLPTRNRHFMLIEPDELIPKDEAEKAKLVARYGSYILDGMAGDCDNSDGSNFLLRIGYKGREHRVTDQKVLDVVSHEYGHTLGEDLETADLEELKAYAFRSLFVRFYNGVDVFCDNIGFLSPEKTHDIALHKLEQLTMQGICEEEILAHLTGQPFGGFTPDSYLVHLSV